MSTATFRSALAAALALLFVCAAPGIHAAPFAYVSSVSAGTVSVVDLASSSVVATVSVGKGPLGVAVNAAGSRVYVANGTAGSVSVIDTTSNLVADTIALGSNPAGIAVTPDGTRVYVTMTFDNSVIVIDTASNAIVATVAVANPFGIAVGPNGQRVYVGTDSFGGPLSVIDTASNTVVASVAVGNVPRGVAVHPGGSRVYIANQFSGTVSVLDTFDNTIVATVPVGVSPYGIVVDPAGAHVYVTNSGSASVSVIDTATNLVSDTIDLGAGDPAGVAMDAFGTLLLVAQSQPSGLRVIGGPCNEVLATIDVGDSPSSMGLFVGPGGSPAPPPPGPLSTSVTSIEVTQGIQDVANSVPLVRDRRTFARVHVRSDGAAVAGVTASLRGLATQDAAGNPVNIDLGTLVPSNAGGERITIGPEPKRSIIEDSFLFELPWAWSSNAGMRLHASLSAPGGAAPASCARDVACAPLLSLATDTSLTVAFVRMAYALPGAAPGSAGALVESTGDDQRRAESWLRRGYPLAQLHFAADFALFDPALGSRVDRSSPDCAQLPSGQRSQCAYDHVGARLGALAMTSSFMDGADLAYGLVPQITQPPFAFPNPLFTRGGCCTNRVAAGPANDADHAAHQIGHFLGRQHPVAGAALCGHSADDADYPYVLSYIAGQLADPATSLAGFDAGDPTLLLARGFHAPRDNFDLMGYCQPTTWISDYSYRALATSLQALHPAVGDKAGATLPLAPLPGDWLLVFGQIAADRGQATLLQVARVDAIFEQAARPPGDFSIRLLDAAGATLADYPFAPLAIADSRLPGGAGSARLGFGHAVAFAAGSRTVQIVDNSTASVLASRSLSPNAPVVDSVSVRSGPDPITGAIGVAWTAHDADGDALVHDLYLSRDGGATLQPLLIGATGSSATIDSSRLGGGLVQFRVVANDGGQTAWAETPLVSLANRRPLARILAPAEEARFSVGEVINLEGGAIDPQDGELSGSSLSWSSEQGVIGSGGRVSTGTLAAGTHLLSLTATGSSSLAATQTVMVTVIADGGIPGPTLTAGPAELGWQVAAGDFQIQSTTLDVGNRGSGVLQFEVSSGAAWLTSSVQAATAPATIVLSGDPAGLGDGRYKDTTITLTATGFPQQSITVPVRLSMGDTFSNGNAALVALSDGVFEDGFE